MNIDVILATMNAHDVQYLLIGGMNFMLRHAPMLTYDVDLWIEDSGENRARCANALAALGAAWGPTESDWKPVAALPPGWLARQAVFSLTTTHGAVDIFRRVDGLVSWSASWAASAVERTATGTPYRGLSDADMLRCQEALAEEDRKPERMRQLRAALKGRA